MRSTATLVVLAVAVATGCAGMETDGQTIGARGGTLESEDGRLTAEIRRDALDEEMELAVMPADCEDPAAVGCYEFEPWGVMLAVPAWVVFDYHSVVETSQMVPTSLALMVEGPDGMDPMSDANYDADEGLVWASTMYLTSVHVVAE